MRCMLVSPSGVMPADAEVWLTSPDKVAAKVEVGAAAVVKAGVYLLIRFSTIFHDVAVWNRLLIVVGMGTAVMSAVCAAPPEPNHCSGPPGLPWRSTITGSRCPRKYAGGR